MDKKVYLSTIFNISLPLRTRPPMFLSECFPKEKPGRVSLWNLIVIYLIVKPPYPQTGVEELKFRFHNDSKIWGVNKKFKKNNRAQR